MNWRPGKVHYWESLPVATPDNPISLTLAEESKQKPALVLIHGYAASVEHWRHTFNGLKGRYRIYGLDLLGFGQSDKPDGSTVRYTAKFWARQVRDFLKSKNEERAVICGHSLGGMVALEFYRQYPDMVEGLVLIDSSGLPDQGRAEVQSQNGGKDTGGFSLGELTYNLIKAPLVGETLAALLASKWVAKRSLEQAYYNPTKVTPTLVEQFLTPLRSPGAKNSYLAVTRNFAEYQLPIQPGDIKAKTLIIWGQFDKSMPPAVMLPRWRKLIPEAKVYVVEKAGHCPHDERPDLVNPQIMHFMESFANLTSSRLA
ncbi:MAG: alpha/beta fold hydrolase [Chloroflexota bacterium]|nr:alpha/beta fold hydrolase [Chloroflexota bacterium]